MKELIDKSAIVAEIKRIEHETNYEPFTDEVLGKRFVCRSLLSYLDTLEAKEINEELQGLEKEVAEGTVNRINKKRIPIELKGEVKAKFKNEFHTMWQTIHGISFANVAKPILERLCLHFAAWGVYNLKENIKMKPEEVKLDAVEVKEVDLEKEIKEVKHNYKVDDNRHTSICSADIEWLAKHFFELGLKTRKGE